MKRILVLAHIVTAFWIVRWAAYFSGLWRGNDFPIKVLSATCFCAIGMAAGMGSTSWIVRHLKLINIVGTVLLVLWTTSPSGPVNVALDGTPLIGLWRGLLPLVTVVGVSLGIVRKEQAREPVSEDDRKALFVVLSLVVWLIPTVAWIWLRAEAEYWYQLSMAWDSSSYWVMEGATAGALALAGCAIMKRSSVAGVLAIAEALLIPVVFLNHR